MCVYVGTCVHAYVHECRLLRGHKRAPDLELQAVVSNLMGMLKLELRSSERASSTLHHRATSLIPARSLSLNSSGPDRKKNTSSLRFSVSTTKATRDAPV